MDFRRKRVVQAGGVARQPCLRSAPKTRGSRHALSLVLEVGKLHFPVARSEDAGSPAAREACRP
eukprot:6494117-Alexandrium_andersonii.AAC.1